MSTLKGCTILITGGSRGIGQAMAERCAKEGANIAVVAKGGPIDIDVSDANSIQYAVNETVKQFGGIDVLINNVSTFHFTDTVHTTPEKLDLLYSVNVRATFLMSQACIPHLKKSDNPHILNISPPLDMNPRWFTDHLPFTLTKFGMSLCTLGMSSEFKSDGIAVNSLWPMTTIATTTIEDHFNPKIYAGSRWPSIMGDAAVEILKRNSKDCTGYFFLDEEILRQQGIIDFSQYAVDPSALLAQDLFVPKDRMTLGAGSIPLEKDDYIL
jgi:citronellol/citronellal dehydrogenase